MPTIMPEGEKLRQAVKWISDTCQDNPSDSLRRIIEKAALRYNLSPKEEVYLMSFYKTNGSSPVKQG